MRSVRMASLGVQVGSRMLELVCFREKQVPPSPSALCARKLKVTSGWQARRTTRIIDMLQFVQTEMWQSIFGKPADELQKSTESGEHGDGLDTTCTDT